MDNTPDLTTESGSLHPMVRCPSCGNIPKIVQINNSFYDLYGYSGCGKCNLLADDTQFCFWTEKQVAQAWNSWASNSADERSRKA